MRVKTWISEEKNDHFALDQTTMYGDAMCEPFKMIEQLNGKNPIRTLKKTVDFALWRKKRLFCSRSDKNVWRCYVWHEQLNGRKPLAKPNFFDTTVDFALWRKKNDYFALDQTTMFGDAICDTKN